jgi:hypothetical protein
MSNNNKKKKEQFYIMCLRMCQNALQPSVQQISTKKIIPHIGARINKKVERRKSINTLITRGKHRRDIRREGMAEKVKT